MPDLYEIANGLDRYDASDAVLSSPAELVFHFEKARRPIPVPVTYAVSHAEYQTFTGHPWGGLVHDPALSSAENDWDGDGISNRDEILVFETDPRSATSFPRAVEVLRSLIQNQASLTTKANFQWLKDGGTGGRTDTDGDGLPDWYELVLHTYIDDTDSDHDGMDDGDGITLYNTTRFAISDPRLT